MALDQMTDGSVVTHHLEYRCDSCGIKSETSDYRTGALPVGWIENTDPMTASTIDWPEMGASYMINKLTFPTWSHRCHLCSTARN